MVSITVDMCVLFCFVLIITSLHSMCRDVVNKLPFH